MSSRQIRPLTNAESDNAARCAVHNAVFPSAPTTIEQLKYWDEWWDPKYRRQSFLAEVNGVPVATASYAEWVWWYEPGRYVLDIQVHPGYRRQGIGAALYDRMRQRLADEQPKGRILMCKCYEDQPESVRFIAKRGFPQTGRDAKSRLDVLAFDPQRFADICEGVRRQGIEIVAYPELVKRDPNCHRKCYDLTWASIQAMPATGQRTRQSFEQYLQQTFEDPKNIPDGYFIALDGSRYVGESSLYDEYEDAEHLGVGYTGVIPEYRRRGIATALKVHCIQYAKEHGAKSISTGNDETNPMYQINLRLGFIPLPGELLFELKLDTPDV
jgi:GNAT superfamily N-acetyltransferase